VRQPPVLLQKHGGQTVMSGLNHPLHFNCLSLPSAIFLLLLKNDIKGVSSCWSLLTLLLLFLLPLARRRLTVTRVRGERAMSTVALLFGRLNVIFEEERRRRRRRRRKVVGRKMSFVSKTR